MTRAEGADPLAAWLRLTLIPGIGGESQRRLLKAFGLPQAVFEAGFGELEAVVGAKLAQRLQSADTAVWIICSRPPVNDASWMALPA